MTELDSIDQKSKSMILSSVERKAKKIFSKMPLLPVHDIGHVERVVGLAESICIGEGIDPFLSQVAAWLHDIGRLQEIQAKEKGKKVFHAEESAKQVPALLEEFELDLGEENIKLIQDAVGRHSLLNKEDDSFLAMILRDADRLDCLGAISCPRTFAFFNEKVIFHADNPLKPLNSTVDESYIRLHGVSQIQTFYRNMEWFLMLRVKTAQRMGIPRIDFMIEFLYQLSDEIGGSRQEIDNLPLIKKIKDRIREIEVR